MEYEEFLQVVLDLDFITDREMADAAVKAVLGVLAGNLDEEPARKLTKDLPEPLTYEQLRGRRPETLQISFGDFEFAIQSQLDLNETQARQVIDAVIEVTRDAAGEGAFSEIEKHLPPDWVPILQGS